MTEAERISNHSPLASFRLPAVGRGETASAFFHPLLLVSLSPCRSYSRNNNSRNYSSRPAYTASLSIGRGDVVRTARVPLLYPCRYAREKLSVRESDRRSSALAFCPRRFSVGRAHHYRKRMHSIRRFRTKLTFRINILHLKLGAMERHTTSIHANCNHSARHNWPTAAEATVQWLMLGN